MFQNILLIVIHVWLQEFNKLFDASRLNRLYEITLALVIDFLVPRYDRLLPPNWKPEEQNIS